MGVIETPNRSADRLPITSRVFELIRVVWIGHLQDSAGILTGYSFMANPVRIEELVRYVAELLDLPAQLAKAAANLRRTRLAPSRLRHPLAPSAGRRD